LPRVCILSTRQEIVVLKKKNWDFPVAVKIDHFINDRLRLAQPPQWAALLFIKRSNAARRSNPTDIRGYRESKP